jgi:deoxyribodipyrimidine photo-lyase
MIQKERIQPLNKNAIKDRTYVFYWMQAAQRSEYNHALEFAIEQANRLHKPLLVGFGLTESYPAANERHYTFMLEGLRETQASLRRRGIALVIRRQSPELAAVEWAQDACLVVTDRGYLGHQKRWRNYVARRIEVPLIQVETEVIVPVAAASGKEEWAAATFRPKISRQLDHFLIPLRKRQLKKDSLRLKLDSFDIQDITPAVARLDIDHSVGPSPVFHGGGTQARRLLGHFIRHKLDHFAELRNDPSVNYLSHMSPYLHFGQISPLYIALKVSTASSAGKEAYLEELIVRRELALNFVHYQQRYGAFAALPAWARATLRRHTGDRRVYLYTRRELEQAQTHDPYWNAAQMEMVLTGKMHGYMRMFIFGRA